MPYLASKMSRTKILCKMIIHVRSPCVKGSAAIKTVCYPAICTINLSQKINKDYSNIDSVEKFTLRSDNNYIFTIPLELDSTGKKITVIGYIDEHFFDEKTKNLEHSTKRTYISIPINKL